MVHLGRNMTSEQLRDFREHQISKRFAVVMRWQRGPLINGHLHRNACQTPDIYLSSESMLFMLRCTKQFISKTHWNAINREDKFFSSGRTIYNLGNQL